MVSGDVMYIYIYILIRHVGYPPTPQRVERVGTTLTTLITMTTMTDNDDDGDGDDDDSLCWFTPLPPWGPNLNPLGSLIPPLWLPYGWVMVGLWLGYGWVNQRQISPPELRKTS